MHNHSSTHSDDITALHFHPISSRALLSASTDGLISISDALEPDEDESVQEVANWGCSVAKANWYSNGGGYNVWASSDMETFGLWKENVSLSRAERDVHSISCSSTLYQTWETFDNLLYLVNGRQIT